MSQHNAVVVLSTAPNQIIAQDLAVQILNEKLAACVTIIPNSISFYYWKNQLEREESLQIILKTNTSHLQKLFNYLQLHHTHQIPEILALPVIYGNSDYLTWLNDYLY